MNYCTCQPNTPVKDGKCAECDKPVKPLGLVNVDHILRCRGFVWECRIHKAEYARAKQIEAKAIVPAGDS